MNKLILILFSFLLSFTASAQTYMWKTDVMDGGNTRCKSPAIDNVDECLGTIVNGRYHAPSGKVYGRRSPVTRTAKVVIDAQPDMARVKEVIAVSDRYMGVSYPESLLSNWFVDNLMSSVERLSGKKVDVGVANFGGIRMDMPEGNVILDDMLSMFPFKNQVVYVLHKGSTLKKMLDDMAATKFQVLGGMRVVAQDGKIISAEIGGEPIDDDKLYGVATISFLLEGGDNLRLADDAVELTIFDEYVIDAILYNVKAETAAGRTLTSEIDGRIKLL